jgi:hypothetical protein
MHLGNLSLVFSTTIALTDKDTRNVVRIQSKYRVFSGLPCPLLIFRALGQGVGGPSSNCMIGFWGCRFNAPFKRIPMPRERRTAHASNAAQIRCPASASLQLISILCKTRPPKNAGLLLLSTTEYYR